MVRWFFCIVQCFTCLIGIAIARHFRTEFTVQQCLTSCFSIEVLHVLQGTAVCCVQASWSANTAKSCSAWRTCGRIKGAGR